MSVEKKSEIINTETNEFMNELFNDNEECVNQKRIAIYARVSTKDQLDGYGIDVQLSKCKDYMKLFDYSKEDVHLYVDEGKSAKSIKRTHLNKLIDDIKSGIINEVIIYKLDRLSRDVRDIYYLIDLMVKNNCNLISVMDHLDIHTANGRMLVGILAVIAQWERETDSERTLDSTIEMLEEGLWPFPCPYFGYEIKEHKLEIKKSELEIFNFILDRADDGMPISQIEIELADKFDYHKRADQIRAMLERDIYAGIYVYRGRSYDNVVPAITTLGKLKHARSIFKKRATILKNNKYHYYNKIRTTEGHICFCKPTKKPTHYIYYYEFNRKRINQKKLDEQVLFRLMIYANEKSNKSLDDELRKKAMKLEKKISSIYKQYRKGKINDKSYGYTIQNLHNELEKVRTQKSVSNSKDMTLAKWDKFTDDEKAEFIDQNISYITVDLDLKIVVNITFK